MPHTAGEKLKMHKAIYLLQEMGTVCGDFNFFWHINGPYSHELHRELLEIEENYSAAQIHEYSSDCAFNPWAEEAIEKLKEMFSKAQNYGYTPTEWCEALGSIHFIKKYRSNCESDEKIIATLEREKVNLNKHDSNVQALYLLREYNCL